MFPAFPHQDLPTYHVRTRTYPTHGPTRTIGAILPLGSRQTAEESPAGPYDRPARALPPNSEYPEHSEYSQPYLRVREERRHDKFALRRQPRQLPAAQRTGAAQRCNAEVQRTGAAQRSNAQVQRRGATQLQRSCSCSCSADAVQCRCDASLRSADRSAAAADAKAYSYVAALRRCVPH
jgi:hypothetical protein